VVETPKTLKDAIGKTIKVIDRKTKKEFRIRVKEALHSFAHPGCAILRTHDEEEFFITYPTLMAQVYGLDESERHEIEKIFGPVYSSEELKKVRGI